MRAHRRVAAGIISGAMACAGLVTSVVTAEAAAGAAQDTIVTNTNDAGAGSLRSAIEVANDPLGQDHTVEFDIAGGGPHVISPLTELPTITATNFVMDGYTQNGAAPAAAGATAALQIRIDAAGLDYGLKVVASHTTITGLAVTGADSGDGDGIWIEGHDNTVSGSYVGLTINGENAASNSGNGIVVHGENNVIGGATTAERNVISTNQGAGVLLVGYQNFVAGNRIGTDDDGTTARGNAGPGVEVQGTGNVVGGPTAASRNLLSANSDGVSLTDAGTDNEVQNNYIGTNAAGSGALGNTPGKGVEVESDGSLVAGNVISNNQGSGVHVEADRVLVRNNRVGTNPAGTAPRPNGLSGVFVLGRDNRVGGVGFGNVISGNNSHGVWLREYADVESTGNVVQGNKIGTNTGGNVALGNQGGGVLAESPGNRIGGSQPGQGNIVSGNPTYGVQVTGDDNNVEGNRVGTNASGTIPIANLGNGIELFGNGGHVAENTVGFNDSAGIRVDVGTGNTLLANLLLDNGEMGIDIGPNGPLANDLSDGDAGANDLMNYPEVTGAVSAFGTTQLEWEVAEGLPQADLIIEFYASAGCDSVVGGAGEAERLLGAVTLTTDAAGNASGQIVFLEATVPGEVVVATATVVHDNWLDVASTSELSPCQTVV